MALAAGRAALAIMAINLTIFVIARAAGVSLEAPGFGTDRIEPIPFGAVVAASVVPATIGAAALAGFARLGRKGWLLVGLGGFVLGVVSGPWAVEVSTGVRVALGSMHVLDGLVWAVSILAAAPAEPTSPPEPR